MVSAVVSTCLVLSALIAPTTQAFLPQRGGSGSGGGGTGTGGGSLLRRLFSQRADPRLVVVSMAGEKVEPAGSAEPEDHPPPNLDSEDDDDDDILKFAHFVDRSAQTNQGTPRPPSVKHRQVVTDMGIQLVAEEASDLKKSDTANVKYHKVSANGGHQMVPIHESESPMQRPSSTAAGASNEQESLPSPAKPKFRKVKTSGGFQFVKDDSPPPAEDSPSLKTPIKANTKAKTEEPPIKYKKISTFSGGFEFVEDKGQDIPKKRAPTKESRPVKIKQVQTAAGYQLVEYYEGDDTPVDPAAKFGIQRAEYAETWRSSKTGHGEKPHRNEATEGTEVTIGAPTGMSSDTSKGPVKIKQVKTAAGIKMVEYYEDDTMQDPVESPVEPMSLMSLMSLEEADAIASAHFVDNHDASTAEGTTTAPNKKVPISSPEAAQPIKHKSVQTFSGGYSLVKDDGVKDPIVKMTVPKNLKLKQVKTDAGMKVVEYYDNGEDEDVLPVTAEEEPPRKVRLKQVKTDAGFKLVEYYQDEEQDENDSIDNEYFVAKDEASASKAVKHKKILTSGGSYTLVKDDGEESPAEEPAPPQKKNVKVKQVQTDAGYEFIKYDEDDETVGDTRKNPLSPDAEQELLRQAVKEERHVENSKESVKFKKVRSFSGGYSLVEDDGKSTPVEKKAQAPKNLKVTSAKISPNQSGIKRADYVESWRKGSPVSEAPPVAPDGNLNQVNDGKEAGSQSENQPPLQTAKKYKKVEKFSGGFEFVEDKGDDKPIVQKVKPKNLKVKQVQTAAGFQMVEYYDDEENNSRTNPVDKFGIKRAEYAETWMKPTSNGNTGEIVTNANEGEKSKTPKESPATTDRSTKPHQNTATQGTEVNIAVPTSPQTSPMKVKKVKTFSGGYEFVEDNGDDVPVVKKTVPKNLKVKQVPTAAGFEMVEYFEDDTTERKPNPVEKFGIKRAEYAETWRASTRADALKAQKAQGDSNPARGDASKHYQNEATKGTEVKIGVPTGLQTSPKKVKKIKTFSGGYEFVEDNGDEKPEIKQAPPKNLKVKQVQTAAGFQMVEYYEDENAENKPDPIEKFGIKRADYAQTWLKPSSGNLGIAPTKTDQAKPLDASVGTYVTIGVPTEGAQKASSAARGTPKTDQEKPLEASLGTSVRIEAPAHPQGKQSKTNPTQGGVKRAEYAETWRPSAVGRSPVSGKGSDVSETDQDESFEASLEIAEAVDPAAAVTADPSKTDQSGASKGTSVYIQAPSTEEESDVRDTQIVQEAKNLKVKQVQTAAGYRMVEYYEDKMSKVETDPTAKFGIKRAEYTDTWRSNRFTTAGDAAESKPHANEATKGTEVNIGAPIAKRVGPKKYKKVKTFSGGFEFVEDKGGDGLTAKQAPPKNLRVKQVQTAAGFRMVDYYEDEDVESTSNPVQKFGIKRAEYAETWLSSAVGGSTSDHANAASVGTSVTIRAPTGGGAMKTLGMVSFPSKTDQDKPLEASLGTSVHISSASAAKKNVESTHSGVKKAEYAETWRSSSLSQRNGVATARSGIPQTDQDKPLEASLGTSVPIEAHAGGHAKKVSPKPTQMGARRAEYTSTWRVLARNGSERNGGSPAKGGGVPKTDQEKPLQASLGTSVRVGMPTKSEGKNEKAKQTPQTDQAKPLAASHGTFVTIGTTSKSSSIASDPRKNDQLKTMEGSVSTVAPIGAKSHEARNSNVKQVKSPLGIQAAEKYDDGKPVMQSRSVDMTDVEKTQDSGPSRPSSTLGEFKYPSAKMFHAQTAKSKSLNEKAVPQSHTPTGDYLGGSDWSRAHGVEYSSMSAMETSSEATKFPPDQSRPMQVSLEASLRVETPSNAINSQSAARLLTTEPTTNNTHMPVEKGFAGETSSLLGTGQSELIEPSTVTPVHAQASKTDASAQSAGPVMTTDQWKLMEPSTVTPVHAQASKTDVSAQSAAPVMTMDQSKLMELSTVTPVHAQTSKTDVNAQSAGPVMTTDQSRPMDASAGTSVPISGHRISESTKPAGPAKGEPLKPALKRSTTTDTIHSLADEVTKGTPVPIKASASPLFSAGSKYLNPQSLVDEEPAAATNTNPHQQYSVGDKLLAVAYRKVRKFKHEKSQGGFRMVEYFDYVPIEPEIPPFAIPAIGLDLATPANNRIKTEEEPAPEVAVVDDAVMESTKHRGQDSATEVTDELEDKAAPQNKLAAQQEEEKESVHESTVNEFWIEEEEPEVDDESMAWLDYEHTWTELETASEEEEKEVSPHSLLPKAFLQHRQYHNLSPHHRQIIPSHPSHTNISPRVAHNEAAAATASPHDDEPENHPEKSKPYFADQVQLKPDSSM